jgi:hypothetical protein
MLSFAGSSATAAEASAAIAACRSRELGDAVMTILRYAGRRPQREILGIVGDLLDYSLYEDARRLITFAQDT